jgi:hypothetical protein
VTACFGVLALLASKTGGRRIPYHPRGNDGDDQQPEHGLADAAEHRGSTRLAPVAGSSGQNLAIGVEFLGQHRHSGAIPRDDLCRRRRQQNNGWNLQCSADGECFVLRGRLPVDGFGHRVPAGDHLVRDGVNSQLEDKAC